jgi:hypothetical protein
MNWAKYLVNQLELDFRKAQDQGYEFHFSWLLILIVFTSWEMSKGVTFPDIEPFEPACCEVHLTLVLERYGKIVAVECGLSYVLSPIEEVH